MGNTGSASGGRGTGRQSNRSHHHNTPSILQPPPLPEVSVGNRYIFTAAMPYAQYPHSNPPQYYHNVNYYPHPPALSVPLPAPLDHHHQSSAPRIPCSSAPSHRLTAIEHQKAITIRNDVNIKKETLVIEPDEENPGRYLVAFTFDATVAGSITVLFFSKETFDCNLLPTKNNLITPVAIPFNIGIGQKFKQPSGTGIDFSFFNEIELISNGETEVYPLTVKAEARPVDRQGPALNFNAQITQAVFDKNGDGEYRVRVVKQILWANGRRYELQEIYGMGNSVDGNFDGDDAGKECVVCLSESRNTTVLPCRHMCLCSECAKLLRHANGCPICRQPVERLLEIKLNEQQRG